MCIMIGVTNHVTSFKGSQVWLLVSHIYYLTHTKIAKHVVVLPPCLPVINPYDTLQKWIIKTELAIKDERAAKKQRLITYKELQKTADCGNINTVALERLLICS